MHLSAKPVPDNLGNGLDKLVTNNLIQKGVITAVPRGDRTTTTKDFATYTAMIGKQATGYMQRAMIDSTTGKYLVQIMPNGRVPVTILQTTLQAAYPTISVQATDQRYADHGVIEAYLVLDDVPRIANAQGVGSVILELRPIHSAGAVTSQGVHLHRVNRINNFYNAGVDSFDSEPAAEGGDTTAAMDVGTGDLPGTGNTDNSQPVVVLQDFNSPPFATNEGRAMCQIVHDMAPQARIGFATADSGELGFANNIRALAGLNGYTYPDATQQGFKADVVCDDVSYLDEAMFQDGIIAQGVNDVVAAGVSYASSAANNWSVDGYQAPFRYVANGKGLIATTNTALKNTNINLAGVPPELYAGGFHNFNPSGSPAKVDVAQTINSGSDALAFVFQWNDPYDANAPALIDPAIFTGNGDSEGGQGVDFGPVALTAGNSYVISELATPATPADNFDAIVAVIDPNGNFSRK
ncbi:MAG: hypothetical protein DMF29_03570 [Verrucomicrobia bacterium]|nr:MAG: hypothetical protein DMF29_03570 [Verrucomicrobiota bacterium]